MLRSQKKYQKADFYAVERLVHSLYYLIGKDQSGKGLIDVGEKQDFLNGNNLYISRLWTDPHIDNPVMFNIDSDGYEITVMGFSTPRAGGV